ncbi:PIN domain-containing protein [Ottowia sp.]|uniref:PIN domain-containing protein n=1 Tax=Ottowia sp. TaxID=1898956 RepID=UPI002D0B7AE1|nr:PIN domain-containing protein [Ottowia sp.]MCP5259265.1 PIN domain-containing protein [Burkholderiaceae bacterium]HRW71111.1 PIN domain-containing protein [Ottowia sp.]
MTPLVFVDTPVFLRTADDRDLAKQARAREWVRWCWEARAGRVSTQVLNELYHNAITRFGARMPVQQARTQVRDLRQWQPPHLDTYTIDGAWALQDRHGLDYWEALIVSSAQQQGCRYLLTDNLPHAQRFETVEVLDPFRVGPDQLPSQDEP